MRLDTLRHQKAKSNTSYNEDLGRGHINGFFVTAPYATLITIRLRTKEGTVVIASRESLTDFSNNSSFISGINTRNNYGRKQLFNYAIDSTALNSGSIKEYLNRDHLEYVKIPVGSIYLDGGDEIEITLDVGPIGNVDTPNASDELVISTYSNDRQPYYITGYETVNDTTTTFYNSVRIFAKGGVYGTDPNNPKQNILLKDPSFQLDVDGEGSFLADYSEFSSMSSVEKGIEFNYTPVRPMLYENLEAILPDVYIRVSGDGEEKISFFNVWRKYIESKTSHHTVSQAEKNLKMIEKLQQSDAEQAKALKNAGRIPDTKELKNAIEYVKTKMKQEQKENKDG